MTDLISSHQETSMTDINIVILLRAGHITQYNANRAADEIERLRAALTDIAQHQDSEWPLRCQMNVRTARAVLKEPT